MAKLLKAVLVGILAALMILLGGFLYAATLGGVAAGLHIVFGTPRELSLLLAQMGLPLFVLGTLIGILYYLEQD